MSLCHSPAMSDYRRLNNYEMWQRLDLPRVEWTNPEVIRLQHNLEVSIKRAIWEYEEGMAREQELHDHGA